MRKLVTFRPRRRSRGVLTVLVAAMACLFIGAPTASAHGTIIGPPTRAYQCWDDWGSDHMNPNLPTLDPMCSQAFKANPDTMWNWMSALRDGLNGNFQGSTPDGQLCSNALSRNNSLNRAGGWKTTTISNNFTMHLYDQANHGSDFIRVYVSKNGFNPATQTLGWGNLDFITQVGPFPQDNNITFPVRTSGYTGHHVVFTIWQAAHLDQTYMWCSDVIFS